MRFWRFLSMQKLKKVLGFFWETAGVIALAFAIIIPIRFFLFQPFFVRGASMEPNFHHGEYLIIDELSYRVYEPERSEVIVFRYPNDTSQFYIKRIVGLPGETVSIRGGKVYIRKGSGAEEALEEQYLPMRVDTTGELTITLGPDEYFVMGDNRSASSDSRRWGGLEREFFIGRVWLTLWPPEDFKMFDAPLT